MITVKTQYNCVSYYFFHNPQSMNQGELKQTLFLNGICVCYEYDSKKYYMSKRACVLNIIPATVQAKARCVQNCFMLNLTMFSPLKVFCNHSGFPFPVH